MIIDCGSCAVRGTACADCVVTFLTIPVRAGAPAGEVTAGRAAGAGRPPDAIDLDAAERGAITVLAQSGLVPPLRMRPAI